MDYTNKFVRQKAFQTKLEDEHRRNLTVYYMKATETEAEEENDEEDMTKIKGEMKMKEAYQRKKDIWLQKRKECNARAGKFSELRRKRLKEKEILNEPLAGVEDPAIWMELENVIKDNQMALKGLENYKVTVEIKETEEKIKEIQSKSTENSEDCWFVPLSDLHYEKEAKIGQGKFGSVYSGSFRRNISVAVKILRNKSGSKEKLVKDFLKEKNVMTRLKHPNLVQLYAISKDDQGNDILVQELLENGCLLDYLLDSVDCEDISFKSVLVWCVHVARGMAHLERLKIVHRDLATRNVLLDENKRAKVADFGMALSDRQPHTNCDYLPVRWTAPEAVFDKQFSSASDVWSFGITLWEIFTFGEKPFKSLGIKEYKERMRKDSEMKMNEFRCQQPHQLTKATEKEKKNVYKMMTKCWDINPTERPQFCDLEEDLHHFHLTGDLIGYGN